MSLSRRTGRRVPALAVAPLVVALAAPALALVSDDAVRRPAPVMGPAGAGWLERPGRDEEQRPDEVIRTMGLRDGDTVADIGAGPGVLSLPVARAVSPGGKVYAVDIDQAFIDHIQMRAREQHLDNVKPILGKVTDPNLPARDVDVALFHDVLHHIEDRAGYLKTMAGYVKPNGRVAIVELSPEGGHKGEPALIVTKDQVNGWMDAAGFRPSEDIPGLNEGKWFVIYVRK